MNTNLTGLGCFQKSLRPYAFDESSLCIDRVPLSYITESSQDVLAFSQHYPRNTWVILALLQCMIGKGNVLQTLPHHCQ